MDLKKTIAILFSGCSLLAFAQAEPYRNPALSADERAADLLSRMTLEEKISQLNNNSPGVERLGIPAYNWWNESLHGVGRAGVATVFPQAIGMAATFNPDELLKTFDMISTEQRAKYNEGQRNNLSNQYRGLTVWTPNINIFRDPRWGRGQETYGEDPYLTSVMGLAVVGGLQGTDNGKYDKLHACAKHFAVHSGPEWNRHSFDAANISKRDLWETYLPAFEALVCDGHVKEVMCAYNRFEGQPCCSNKIILKDILRNQWGYDDVVVSDCGAISDFYRPFPKGHGTHEDEAHAASDAILSGNDLECVGMAFWNVKDAIDAGLIKEEDIDKSVYRLLRARFQLGNLFDNELTPWWNIPVDSIASDSHRRQALDMARKSMVLMSNRNDVLPVGRNVRKIAVVGPNANDSVMMWGNYNGIPKSTVTVFDGIRREFPQAEVVYVPGCGLVEDLVMNSCFNLLSHDGQPGLKATYYAGKDLEGEPLAVASYSDPLNFTTNGATVFAPGVPLEMFSARYEGTLTSDRTGDISFYIKADDGYRLLVDGKEIASEWKNGGKQEKTYTIPVENGKTYDVVLEFYQDRGTGTLKMDIGNKAVIDYAAVAKEVSDADLVVFVGGLSPSIEGEEMGVKLDGFRGGDRTKIELPAVQTNMMKALKANGAPLVFVICGGGSVAIPWEAENCDAIINAFYPGEAGGTAVAEVLSGAYNPAGRLPMTYYSSTDELPDYEDYDMIGRTYRYYDGTPLFPFGHGLSYTDFEYGDAKVSKLKFKKGEDIVLTVPVANTGGRDGEEVVQVYIRNLADPYGPIKSLRAFRRVPVRKGETVDVAFTLTPESFESFDKKKERMDVLKGDYEILYGGSSDAAALKSLKVKIK